MASGAVILAISAVFATKANKKLTPGIKTVYAPNIGAAAVLAYGSAIFTVNNASGYVPVYMLLYTGTVSVTSGTAVGSLLYEEAAPKSEVYVYHGSF